MLSQSINKTLKALALCTGLVSTSHFAQANDFVNDPNYLNFKQKAMNTYGLSSVQVDAAMSGAKKFTKHYKYYDSSRRK